ncbi:MAG: membrane dipeptidase, partial [Chloroflexota bacterium]
NALKYGRDLRRPLAEIRQAEEGSELPNGRATVSLPELLKGGVGLVFSTLYVAPANAKMSEAQLRHAYRTPAEAHRLAMAQLDYYHRLADELTHLRLVGDTAALDEVVASHQPGHQPLLGLLPLMEGADPIRTPEEAEDWYARGLRVIGLAWDDTRYAAGAWKGAGGLTQQGHRLLEVMAEFGFILDLTHLSEQATLEALDRYEGPVVATHCNPRALVPALGQRHLTDSQLRRLVERNGIVGIVLFNLFLKDDYQRGEKHTVALQRVVDHIDYVCQLAGDAAHVGLGSDFDGGLGAADVPAELDSIADLPKIGQALRERGYAEEEVTAVLGGNWLRFLRASLS